MFVQQIFVVSIIIALVIGCINFLLLTSPDVAKLLSDITTLNYIPTGSPSSQILAYFAYEEMFINMFNVSQEFNCKMTLYVDDLTFSKGNSFNYQN